jgi:hypothetical protein
MVGVGVGACVGWAVDRFAEHADDAATTTRRRDVRNSTGSLG